MTKNIKEVKMQTIQFQIDDEVYQNIKDSGIDIQDTLKDFLYKLTDDGYQSLSLEEAKARVDQAVQEYKNGTMKTVSHNDMWDSIDSRCEEQIGNRV